MNSVGCWHCPILMRRFGREDELLTPAYWAMRCVTADPTDIDFVNHLGTLEEKVGF